MSPNAALLPSKLCKLLNMTSCPFVVVPLHVIRLCQFPRKGALIAHEWMRGIWMIIPIQHILIHFPSEVKHNVLFFFNNKALWELFLSTFNSSHWKWYKLALSLIDCYLFTDWPFQIQFLDIENVLFPYTGQTRVINRLKEDIVNVAKA